MSPIHKAQCMEVVAWVVEMEAVQAVLQIMREIEIIPKLEDVLPREPAEYSFEPRLLNQASPIALASTLTIAKGKLEKIYANVNTHAVMEMPTLPTAHVPDSYNEDTVTRLETIENADRPPSQLGWGTMIECETMFCGQENRFVPGSGHPSGGSSKMGPEALGDMKHTGTTAAKRDMGPTGVTTGLKFGRFGAWDSSTGRS
ncbi:hypothetical protein K505DRAFT_332238 [Melanomma pulvis-pyrius CBS 109.77]|uniref:Uncharacterized protein n=1 Tax=Melanomma pulvis-pyrius CBS 109.77 TaxID=1314802 RepID=A0A6A6XVI3_9PLEO|nr:hypothetical protein K505DRAFT_332238 [Melanomma pulvis-pyrius CBS 109.77]